MTNELDEIVALEERWIRHGGPMTFSEFETWEWDEMRRDADMEYYRRQQEAEWAKHPRKIFALPNNWSGASSSISPAYWLPAPTGNPGTR